MSQNKQKLLSRSAIYGSLLIWLMVQFTQLLKPLGIPGFKSDSIVVAGLIALPALLSWPWLKGFLFEVADDDPQPSLPDRQHQRLVTVEIVALSFMLLFLLLHV